MTNGPSPLETNPLTLEGLEKVFAMSPSADPLDEAPVVTGGQVLNQQVSDHKVETNHVSTKEGSKTTAMPSAVDMAVLKQLQQITQAPIKIDSSRVSTSDLAFILDGFAKVLRGESLPTAVNVSDRTGEIDELRRLLIEAQDRMISLLTDRVNDRAQIARLEAELRFIPDLQSQADKAMSIAVNTEEFRKELTKVKCELDSFRLARMRAKVRNRRRSFWTGIVSRVLGKS